MKMLQSFTRMLYKHVLFFCFILNNKGFALQEEDGYYINEPEETGAEFASTSDAVECPSNTVIVTRYKCNTNGEWTDCFRRHCCPGYTYIAGRCIGEKEDPCSLNLCEQKCSVFFERVICTCFSGYKFSAENRKKGIRPVCLDIDECANGTHGCEQRCINTPGSYKCGCNESYILKEDQKTCAPRMYIEGQAGIRPNETEAVTELSKGGCMAPCAAVLRLEDKAKEMEEKIQALTTAIRLYSFAAGPSGPEGPPGPEGPLGPRGFPGKDGPAGPQGPPGPSVNFTHLQPKEKLSNEDFPMDSYTVVEYGKKSKFCKCKRGPIGFVGPPGSDGPRGMRGESGPKGEKGDAGSFDFLLLLLADVRHDLEVLREKVFPDEKPPSFDLEEAVRREFEKAEKKFFNENTAGAKLSVKEVEYMIQDEESDTENIIQGRNTSEISESDDKAATKSL